MERKVNVFPLTDESTVANIKPFWSPGGKELWYLSQVQGTEEYVPWKVGLDGCNPRPLNSNAKIMIAREQGDIEWSPGGEYLAYVTKVDNHLEIWKQSIFQTKGTSLTPLKGEQVTEYWAYSPRWSSQNELVFLTNRFGSVDLMLTDTVGRVRVLTRSDASNESYPAWSPSGERLAYFRSYAIEGGEDVNQVFTINRDGSVEMPLTPPLNADLLVPSWSPRGEKVAINVGILDSQLGNRDQGLWLVNADGTQLRRLTSTGGGTLVEWSPDGRKIAFTDASGLLYVLVFPCQGGRSGSLLQITKEAVPGEEIGVIWSHNSRQLLLDWVKPGSANRGIWVVNLPEVATP